MGLSIHCTIVVVIDKTGSRYTKLNIKQTSLKKMSLILLTGSAVSPSPCFFLFSFIFFQLAPVGVVDPLGLKEKRRPCNFLEEKEGINSKENHELQYI
jgi:hypothetical protein